MGEARGSLNPVNSAEPHSPSASVLIVDDNPANLMAFQAVLSSVCHDIVLARSGPHALDLALKRSFAVILLDIRMPEMDGFETAEILRSREATRHTPIIFMSAYDSSPSQVSKGYRAGATDYISSPVDEDVLKVKVAAFIQLHLRQESLKQRGRELAARIGAFQSELAKKTEDPVLTRHVVEIQQALENFLREISSDHR